MVTTPNEHVQITRLQEQIRSHLGLSSDQLFFEYKQGDETTLNLITINPMHEQSFLFKSLKGPSKVECLETMLAYVESYKEKENTYTIQWAVRGEGELYTSYFRGRNIYDVLEKFHFDRDLNSTVIYSIVLSPLT